MLLNWHHFAWTKCYLNRDVQFVSQFQISRLTTAESDSKRDKVDHEQEMRSLNNKHEASVEFLKQEANLAAVKVRNRGLCYYFI